MKLRFALREAGPSRKELLLLFYLLLFSGRTATAQVQNLDSVPTPPDMPPSAQAVRVDTPPSKTEMSLLTQPGCWAGASQGFGRQRPMKVIPPLKRPWYASSSIRGICILERSAMIATMSRQ